MPAKRRNRPVKYYFTSAVTRPGHPPILFSNRSNSEVRSIEQNGFCLGMFPEAVYASIEIPLQQGDRYVLYTDGLPESTNAKSEEFGLPRCMQFLGSHSRLPPIALADELLSEIARWSARSSGRLQDDDMTLVVIDWLDNANSTAQRWW